MITREDYKTYMRIKSELCNSEKCTQTDDRKRYRDYSTDEDEDEDEDEYESEDKDEYESEDKDEYESEDKDEYESEDESPLKKYTREEIKYYKSLSDDNKIIIDKLEEDISAIDSNLIPMRFKVLQSNMDLHLKAIAISYIDQMAKMNSSSGEYSKLNHYVQNLCKIPIGKYQTMKINSSNSVEDISSFLDTTRKNMDNIVYGHEDAKNQIIRLLAKWISNPNAGGLVIGIEGPMGAGKTTLCKDGICKILGLPFGFITLGGINDSSTLIGSNYTYEGSRWGTIVNTLINTKCMNPVLFFDELDKISDSRRGEEVVNVLIHLTDSTQNDKFHDEYFANIDFDLSKCLIIFSYNNEDLINPILKDRMVTIRTNGYSLKEKIVIANNYMLPQILKTFSFNDKDIIFKEDILTYLISILVEEKGVRNFKRGLEEIVSHLNLQRLLKSSDVTFPLEITTKIIDKYLSKPKKKDEWLTQSMYL